MRRLSTQVKYRNRWMTVREDAVEHEDGGRGIYGVVDKPDFVVVVPQREERLRLIEQFRYPVGGRYWEFPQGSLESEPDAPPEEVARRELAEETGLRADRLERLGTLCVAYGFSSQRCHVFLARDPADGDPDPAPEEGTIRQADVSWDGFADMVRDGRIVDATTIAAFSLLELRGAPGRPG